MSVGSGAADTAVRHGAARGERPEVLVIKPSNFINRSRSTHLDEEHGAAQRILCPPPPSIIPDPDGVRAGSIFRQQGPNSPVRMLRHKSNNHRVVFSEEFTE